MDSRHEVYHFSPRFIRWGWTEECANHVLNRVLPIFLALQHVGRVEIEEEQTRLTGRRNIDSNKTIKSESEVDKSAKGESFNLNSPKWSKLLRCFGQESLK
jgi:hypothetical protein